jgi:signal peptidase I
MARMATLIRELVRENKAFVFFLLTMIMVRSAIADWYGVPSASMYPTLMIGDRIMTNRLAYDIKLPFTDRILSRIADPKRGDIVTFTSPEDGIRLVKRVVGLPGDTIEMRGDELIVNGARAAYAIADGDLNARLTPDYRGRQVVLTEEVLGHQRPIIVMPQRKAVRSFGPVAVPDGQYLMLGDNRDNSMDSRYIGFVKRELLTGQVLRVIFSLDTDKFYLPRVERFGASLI